MDVCSIIQQVATAINNYYIDGHPTFRFEGAFLRVNAAGPLVTHYHTYLDVYSNFDPIIEEMCNQIVPNSTIEYCFMHKLKLYLCGKIKRDFPVSVSVLDTPIDTDDIIMHSTFFQTADVFQEIHPYLGKKYKTIIPQLYEQYSKNSDYPTLTLQEFTIKMYESLSEIQ